jgi:hypothetical protein
VKVVEELDESTFTSEAVSYLKSSSSSASLLFDKKTGWSLPNSSSKSAWASCCCSSIDGRNGSVARPLKGVLD